jgi:hypothetical protein
MVMEESWGGWPESRLWQTAFDGGVESFPGGSPSAIAENSNGGGFVLEVVPTVEEDKWRGDNNRKGPRCTQFRCIENATTCRSRSYRSDPYRRPAIIWLFSRFRGYPDQLVDRGTPLLP